MPQTPEPFVSSTARGATSAAPRRVIVCLDVRDGRVVKGVNFRGLRDVGDPVELADRYEAEGADEVVFLDISATVEGRRTLLDTVRRTADRLSVPLVVGGGVRDVDDVGRALDAGAAKVTINTAGVERPQLFADAAERFGAERIVASIDARRVDGPNGLNSPRGRYLVHTRGGAVPTELEAVEWARLCAELGAGEILLTSIDHDGRRDGYDLELTRAVAEAVRVPVIASGGAGAATHLLDAFVLGGADGALAAGILHDGTTTIAAVKRVLAEAGLPVRAVNRKETPR